MILCHKHPEQEASACPKCENEKLRAALEWIANGFLYGHPECKTVGYIPERPEGQHCPSCWLYHAETLARSALGQPQERKAAE